MLLTVWNQEKDMIKVRSYIKKMFYYLRNVCIIFYSSKTISNKWWAGLIKQLPLIEALPATIAHTWYHSGASGSRLSHVEDERLPLHENFTDTWWEEAESESSVPQQFCQKCLYANDSMSDNL